MIRFIEIVNETNFNPRMERTAIPKFSLSEVWVNEKYVVSVKESLGALNLLKEGRLPDDLNGEHRFTIITTTNGTVTQSHTVVGAPEDVAERLSRVSNRAKLLKG